MKNKNYNLTERDIETQVSAIRSLRRKLERVFHQPLTNEEVLEYWFRNGPYGAFSRVSSETTA